MCCLWDTKSFENISCVYTDLQGKIIIHFDNGRSNKNTENAILIILMDSIVVNLHHLLSDKVCIP